MAKDSLILLKQENLELLEENKALKLTMTKLLEEINRIREIDRTPNPNRTSRSPELRIIEDQITYFEIISYERTLTLDETRTFDLLIKNKRLLDEKKPIEVDYTKVPDTESDLLELAGSNEYHETSTIQGTTSGEEDPLA